MQRPFRFGVNLVAWGDGGQWREKCRRAEQLGYDVLLVPRTTSARACRRRFPRWSRPLR